jgi:plasmid stabilization system protein ParE
MAFKIEYTLRADADLDELLAWLISREAGKAGLRWLNGLIKAIDRLRVMPERCPRYRKDRRIPFWLRRAIMHARKRVRKQLF